MSLGRAAWLRLLMLGALVGLLSTFALQGAGASVEERERQVAEAEERRQQAERREAEARREVEKAAEREAALAAEREEAADRLEESREEFMAAVEEHEQAQAELAETEAELADLEESIARLSQAVEERREQVGALVRDMYMGGGVTTYEAVLEADAARESARRLGYLRGAQESQREVLDGYLADRREMERQEQEVAAIRDRRAQITAELEERQIVLEQRVTAREDELAGLDARVAAAAEEHADLRTGLSQAGEDVEVARANEAEAKRELVQQRDARAAQREREEQERRERERQRTASRDGRSESSEGDGGSGNASSEAEATSASEASGQGSSGGGGVACPVGDPVSFSNTYGAARSGGRRHKGTDMFAPRGTPIYAYEEGTISRMSSNRLGGTTLYLQGDSGKDYYYAHLQGYAGGLSTGQRVSAGQHIAFNGNSGNARSTPPHLHIEVKPGGSANVNPYPLMRQACG